MMKVRRIVKKEQILLVSKKDFFIVNAIKGHLVQCKFDVAESGLNAEQIDGQIENVRLIILYGDEVTESAGDALECIRKHCMETERTLIVIGGKEEFEIIANHIPDALVAERFERPLDMNLLLASVTERMLMETDIGKMRSILVIDDDVSYLHMIREWLKEIYHVGMASSGMQGITWLAKNHADLILLDYEMPITPGPQILEMLESDPASREVPVMFLTGKSDKESIMRVLSLKPAGYLLKSIGRAALLQTLEDFFAENG